MRFKSISSDLLVTIVTLVAAFAAVTAAMASQEQAPGLERYDQASPEPYAYPGAQNLTRVSVASDGTQANHVSYYPSISADGRYVAFYSYASNLAAGDTNGMIDVFVHDRQSSETTRISLASDGAQANNFSYWPSISADGRYVAFQSSASNLVAGDTNEMQDIFVHDRQNGETIRISIASNGDQAYSDSWGASISSDGRYVTFVSDASNLVAGDTNGMIDVFVHDRQNGETTRISVASNGTQANNSSYDKASISADGRYVAFASWASNLVVGDTNEMPDIFVHDRQNGETTRVSLASDGSQANSGSFDISISADGRFVVFTSTADNLVAGDTNGRDDIFVHDRQAGETTRVSVASDGSQAIGSSSNSPSISADGRYVTFYSYASNLVPGDTNGKGDIFVHDRQAGETIRIPTNPAGFQSNASSYAPSISGNGRVIAFTSKASNLVAGDTNGFDDVFVYDSFGKLAPTDGATTVPLSPTLSWQASESAASYEYCYSSVPGPCTKWNSAGANTSVNLSGLAPNYTYYWQARAVNPGGVVEADNSTWWSFTTTTESACTWPAYTEPASATFGDVPMTVGHWSWVERLANTTITAGCGAGNYCPFNEVNRAQIAIFLLRAKHCGSSYTPPAVGDSTGFNDVPLDATYAPWVKQLAAEGVTAGCGNGNFCPLQVVNRAQMAIFLLRARHGSTYSPPSVGATTGFGDVPLDASYAAWVKQLAAEGVTAGCGNGNFCPLQNVNRAQMATFLVRAFGLP
jgi:archaellum component FlaF (FlaF/FlaG flagellin family)